MPVHNDRKLFEMLILEGAQAGLSWITILRKRENYRKAFDGFDPEKVASYGRPKVRRLLSDEGIVRNRLKIDAAIGNARAYLALRDAGVPFGSFLWELAGGRTRQNAWKTMRQIPARSKESERMSEALLERGFRFVGPTICYAFMQAVGMVNDHLVTCFRHGELR